MLFTVLAHEKLLHLKPTSIPPGDSNEKWVSPSAAGEASGFCIEEQPLLGIGNFVRCGRRKQPKRGGVQVAGCRLAANGLRKPPTQPEMLTKAIASRGSAQEFGQPRRALRNIG